MLAVHDWTSSLVEVRITRAVIQPSPGISLACTRSASLANCWIFGILCTTFLSEPDGPSTKYACDCSFLFKLISSGVIIYRLIPYRCLPLRSYSLSFSFGLHCRSFPCLKHWIIKTSTYPRVLKSRLLVSSLVSTSSRYEILRPRLAGSGRAGAV